MNSDRVAYIFDEMRDEYDDLRDLWYSWLFSRLHYFIAKSLPYDWREHTKKVLDIGCGTGFQSFLYAMAGARVVGIDISKELIFIAQQKANKFKKKPPLMLFPVYFNFVDKYNKLISNILEKKFGSCVYFKPEFIVADALKIPYEDGSFEHVNCCGSTLSFIKDYDIALSEISRVLKPGGTYILEVEAKYNPDIMWPIIDTFLFGRLGYETKLKDAIRIAFSDIKSHIDMEYPFGDVKNPVYMHIKLFAKGTFKKELLKYNLSVQKTFSIHSLTNLIPSTLLDTNTPSKFLTKIFTILAKTEEYLPIDLPGCSLVICGKKI